MTSACLDLPITTLRSAFALFSALACKHMSRMSGQSEAKRAVSSIGLVLRGKHSRVARIRASGPSPTCYGGTLIVMFPSTVFGKCTHTAAARGAKLRRRHFRLIPLAHARPVTTVAALETCPTQTTNWKLTNDTVQNWFTR